jgi:hypothetical protein
MDWIESLINNQTIISIICDIFTSLGTVGAVIISLYFSYRSNNPKPKIIISAKSMVYQTFNCETNRYEDGQNYVCIEVCNLGLFPMEINCFLWRTGFFKKKHHYQSPSAFDRSINYQDHPTINYGQDASHYIPLDLFLEGAIDILKVNKNKFLNWLNVKFYYILVKSNVGTCYKSRINKSLQNEILKKIDAMKG